MLNSLMLNEAPEQANESKATLFLNDDYGLIKVLFSSFCLFIYYKTLRSLEHRQLKISVEMYTNWNNFEM